jgi:hypothetical protein
VAGVVQYSATSSPIAEVHGSYVVCAWLFDATAQATIVKTSLNLTVSNPTTISIVASPSPTYPGRYTTIYAQGYADQGIDVYVTSKPDIAGAGCAATPGQDAGATLFQDTGLGAGSWSDNGFAGFNLTAGNKLLCGWVMVTGASPTDSNSVVATTQRQFDVLTPQYSLTLSAPGSVAYFHTVTVTATWRADAPAVLFVTGIVRGRSCPKNRLGAGFRATVIDLVSVDNGQGYNDNFAQVGAGTATDPASGTMHLAFPPFSGALAGTYLVCGWIQQEPTGSGDPMSTPAVSGPVSLKVVLRPPVTYTGRDSQGRKSGFTLNGRTIIGLSFYARARCATITQYNPLVFPNFRAARNGVFSFIGGSIEGDLKVRLHGHLHRGYATGWFIASWLSGNARCHTGTVTFFFRRHGG